MHVPMSWILSGSWMLDTPVPTPTMTVDPQTVTPGFAGFVAIAVLAFAVVALVLDMLGRVRRAKYRTQIAEELDAELAARDGLTGDGLTEESPAKE